MGTPAHARKCDVCGGHALRFALRKQLIGGLEVAKDAGSIRSPDRNNIWLVPFGRTLLGSRRHRSYGIGSSRFDVDTCSKQIIEQQISASVIGVGTAWDRIDQD